MSKIAYESKKNSPDSYALPAPLFAGAPATLFVGAPATLFVGAPIDGTHVPSAYACRY